MNNFFLKIIALITMTIDHSGLLLVDYDTKLYWIMRSIGRLSFVLFAFLIVEGFIHTKSRKKHLFILVLFACICQLPVLVGIQMPSLNIYFTLFFGVLCLNIIEYKVDLSSNINSKFLIKFLIIVSIIYISDLINVDYGGFGISMILMFYLFNNIKLQKFSKLILLILCYVMLDLLFWMGNIQLYGIFAIIIIIFYNGERGFNLGKYKYVFYMYYPIHLVVLQIISYFLSP